MQKLLYLVHRIPFPPNKGDKIRSFNFLKALAERYDVYLGTFIDDSLDKQYVDDLKKYCKDVLCLDLNPKWSKVNSLRGFVTGEALSLPYYRDPQMQHWVDRTIAEQGIDRVMTFSSPMAQYLDKHTGLRLVADFVDVDSDKWRQYADSKSWPASWVYRREADKLLSFEKRVASRADKTLFVSEREAQLFKNLVLEATNKIDYVNNGVDADAFDPAIAYLSPYTDGIKVIAFTGAMDYWANVDAVKWFAEQVFPLVKQRVPEALFYIVGSKPSKTVQELGEIDDAVIVTGKVDDVRAYVAHAHVVVAPLRIARGIQNKVLEAMAMARPTVVTSAAMEGIPGKEGLHVQIADLPEEFARFVIGILQQPFTCSPENRNYVLADFGWQKNGERLCQFIAGEAG